jgi:YesN/AraC family two-component response regulator
MTAEKKYTVLCVDDERDILDSLSDTFMGTYNVKTALSGEEALKIVKAEDIFLVVSDQRMPGMTGTELLAGVRELKPLCKKILLTGYADVNASIDAINKSGVDNYFSKPWDDDELLSTVSHMLALYKTDTFMENMLAEGTKTQGRLNGALRSNVRLITFLNCYPSGMCVVDEHEKITFVNKKGQDLLRCQATETIMGKSCKDIFPTDDETVAALKKEFLNEKLSFKKVDGVACDGTGIGLNISMLFKNGPDGLLLQGIIFTAF